MKFFPETQRAFAEGELAVRMNRYGGLLDIALINTLHTAERDYPDNYPLKIFSRTAKVTVGRPICGPAVKLLTETADGRVFYHTVFQPVLHPWGVEGDALDMILDDSRILLHAKPLCTDGQVLRMVISKCHLHQGEFRSIKNQRVTSSDGCREHCQRAGVPFNPDWPLKNGPVTMTWQEPVLDSEANLLLLEGTLAYPYGTERLFVSFSANRALEFTSDDNNWILTCRWDSAPADGLDMVISFDSTRDRSYEKSHLETPVREALRGKIAADQALIAAATKIDIPDIPYIQEFTAQSVAYQHSLLLKQTNAIRAAQFKYACFMMWDSLYPIRDLLWHGQFEEAKNIYRSFVDYPWIENSGWCVSQLFLVLEEILSFQKDEAFLREVMPFLMRCLDFQLKLTNPETGLLVSFMNVGVDVPEELGLKGLYYAPCINGWWYGALRFLENIAIHEGNKELQAKIAPIIGKIEANYLPIFLADNGALRSGVPESLERTAIEAFQNTSTIALDYPYGQYLLREALPQLEHYHACRLRHPAGYTALAWDSQVKCEIWKDVHMNQHLGHEVRMARLTGHTHEVNRVVTQALAFCEAYHTCIETLNYSGCEGNETQTSDWQLFACTAINEAIRAGLAGIVRHGGGLRYLPALDSRSIRMTDLRWNGRVITITISGSGRYLLPMEINGTAYPGTAQLPADALLQQKNLCSIHRCDELPEYPVLLQACGAEISQVSVSGRCLSFRIEESGHFPLQFMGNGEFRLKINGQPGPTTSHGWIDGYLNCGDIVSVLPVDDNQCLR